MVINHHNLSFLYSTGSDPCACAGETISSLALRICSAKEAKDIYIKRSRDLKISQHI